VATFVIVHGGWDGGWARQQVADGLRSAGHGAFIPTLTGSGERMHLARRDVDLRTHIQDIVNLLNDEELSDVVLVGSCFGGMVITGVADWVPERLARLVYLDAFVPHDGESLADLLSPSLLDTYVTRARAMGDGWRVPPDPPDVERWTDAPLKAPTTPLKLRYPDSNALPRLFIECTAKPDDSPLTPIFAAMAAQARADGGAYHAFPADHWPPLSHARELAGLLRQLG
jgi:pimeloyl-ACP methyl ester carboxylesterase